MPICEYCGKEHDGSYGSGRFCSPRCSRKYSYSFLDDVGRQNQIKALTDPKNREKCMAARRKLDDNRRIEKEKHKKPKKIFDNDYPFSRMMLGEVGELRTAEEFGKRGIHVYTPVFHDSPIDMIVNINGKLTKIQVKSSTRNDGNATMFKLTSTNERYTGGVISHHTKRYNSDEIDYFALYDYYDDEVFLMKNECNKNTVILRDVPPKNSRGSPVNYKDDYNFDRVLDLIISNMDSADIIDIDEYKVINSEDDE